MTQQLPPDCQNLILSYLPLAQFYHLFRDQGSAIVWKLRYQHRYGAKLYEHDFEAPETAWRLYLFKAGLNYHEVVGDSIEELSIERCLYAACQSNNNVVINQLLGVVDTGSNKSRTGLAYHVYNYQDLLPIAINSNMIDLVAAILDANRRQVCLNGLSVKIQSQAMADLLSIYSDNYRYLANQDMSQNKYKISNPDMAYAAINANREKFDYLSSDTDNVDDNTIYFILDVTDVVTDCSLGVAFMALENVSVTILSKVIKANPTIFDQFDGMASVTIEGSKILKYEKQKARLSQMIELLTPYIDNKHIHKFIIYYKAILGQIEIEEVKPYLYDPILFSELWKICDHTNNYKLMEQLLTVGQTPIPDIFTDEEKALFYLKHQLPRSNFKYVLSPLFLAKARSHSIESNILRTNINTECPGLKSYY